MSEMVYKTLGTSIIYSPMFPPSLFKLQLAKEKRRSKKEESRRVSKSFLLIFLMKKNHMFVWFALIKDDCIFEYFHTKLRVEHCYC